jgi:ankyrin repeat protein
MDNNNSLDSDNSDNWAFTQAELDRFLEAATKQTDLDNQLLEAAKKGQTETIKTLMGMGADIRAKDEYNETALMWATVNGHTDTLTQLPFCFL